MEVPTKGASKIQIKANLGLKDYASFFGKGVKSDNYVDLLALSSNPKGILSGECNRNVSEADWPKCSAVSDLGHCGVPAYSESKSCGFEISTAGLSNFYLVLRTADAWLADVEGSISNLQITPQ